MRDLTALPFLDKLGKRIMKTNLNLPSLILTAYVIRGLYLGAALGDALAILALSALYASHTYLNGKKEPVANKELLDRIVDLEEQIKVTKETVHSIKLGSSLKR